MPLSVKTLIGNHMTLETEALDWIEPVNMKMQDKDGILQDQQRVIFVGKQLEEGEIAQDDSTDKNSTYHLVLRLRGGMQICIKMLASKHIA
jgi:ubiquitin C